LFMLKKEERLKSSPHGLYALGYTRVTWVKTKGYNGIKPE